MKEKMKTATDETYLDLTNLAAKLQKHKAFESELAANKDRIDGLQRARKPIPYFEIIELF